MGGEWVASEIDIAKWAGSETEDEKIQKVFKTEPLKNGALGFDGSPLHYVSVNGTTLDGIDLVDIHDKGWIYYIQNKERKEGENPGMRFKEPWKGGMY